MAIKNIKYGVVLVLFLFTNIGIWVNEHYSNGHLYSIGIFSEAHSCCKTACTCCKSETFVLQLQSNTTVDIAQHIDGQQSFNLIRGISTLELIPNLNLFPVEINTLKVFKIPLIDTSQPLLQVFRC
jgi:hypothetical protein